MESINHEARLRRHQKIGLYSNNLIPKEKKVYFVTKIIFIAFLIGIVDLGYGYFSLNGEYSGEEIFSPKRTEISDTFILEEDGFVEKKNIQTEKRSRDNQNKIIDYIVKRGDTLNSIALDFEISVNTILDANPKIKMKKNITEGEILKILPVNGIFIEIGDKTSIQEISNKYNLSKDIIIKQNNLGSGTLIVDKGTILILPGKSKERRGISIRSELLNKESVYKGDISKKLIKPCAGVITQGFKRGHFGVDIANRNRGPIFAAGNGVVIFVGSGWNGGYGNMIVIDHGKGMQTLYSHNQKVYVKKGDIVKQGQTIGWMGNTGNVRGTTGIHLHFEVIINGKKRNPLAYF